MEPDDQIRRAGFIFDRHERDSLGGSRALAHEHQAGDATATVGFHVLSAEIGKTFCESRYARSGAKGWPRSDSPWAR